MKNLIKLIASLFIRKDKSFDELKSYLREKTGYTYGPGIIHERMNAKDPAQLAAGIRIHYKTLKEEEIITPQVIKENRKFFRAYLLD
jgi:hypothetical protein